jgi:hypothetical protein
VTTPALYATIWVALALFVAGEYGKRCEAGSTFLGKVLPASHLVWWWASACGLAIATAHIVIALAINNDWNHAVAWRVTEQRTRELFGFGWGGAVAANYAFLAYWAVDLWRWRTDPAGLARQPALIRWAARAFVLAIIIPAAIVFAAGPRRALGALVVIGLLWAWRRDRARASEASRANGAGSKGSPRVSS